MGLARLPGSFTASLTLERGVIKVCKRACAFDPRAAGPTNAPMCCPQPGVAVVTPTGARNYLLHGERLPSQLATTTTVTPASTYGHSCGQQRYETGATWRQHGRTWPTLPSHHAVTAAATAVTAASAHTTTDTAINTCRHSTPRTSGCTPLNRTAVPALTPGVSASLAHKKSFTVRDFNCGHTAPATTVTPHQHHGHTSNLWLRRLGVFVGPVRGVKRAKRDCQKKVWRVCKELSCLLQLCWACRYLPPRWLLQDRLGLVLVFGQHPVPGQFQNAIFAVFDKAVELGAKQHVLLVLHNIRPSVDACPRRNLIRPRMWRIRFTAQRRTNTAATLE